MNESVDFDREIWDSLPPLPPRSRLYHLEPVGIGTANVESLTGYISRLAEAHCISVYSLFKYLILPLINKPYVFSGQSFLNKHHIGALNNFSIMASDALQALERLTMRSDLRYLTLLTWSNIIAGQGLMTSNRRWCPVCYEDLRTTNQTIYEPLVWTFRAVQVCLKHARWLQAYCQFCHFKQRWLSQRARPGHCFKCKNWLGIKDDKSSLVTNPPEESEDWAYQRWVIENIGLMLTVTPSLPVQPSKEAVVKSLSVCIDKVSGGDIHSFAKTLKLHQKQIKNWKSSLPKLTPSKILTICYALGVQLKDFLTGNIQAEDFVKLTPLTSQKEPAKDRKAYSTNTDWRAIGKKFKRIIRSRKSLPAIRMLAQKWNIGTRSLYDHFPELCSALEAQRKINREACHTSEERALKAALANKKIPPQSLVQVIRKLGLKSYDRIRKTYPQLCKAFVNQYSRHRAALKLENRRKLEKEVRRVAYQLHRKGKYPSNPKVASLLAVPSRMSTEVARNTLREVQRELGYR